jgi:hypothetical protein
MLGYLFLSPRPKWVWMLVYSKDKVGRSIKFTIHFHPLYDFMAWYSWTTSPFFFNGSGTYYSHFWPIVPAPDDSWGWLWSNWWNEDWQGKPKYSEKTCPSAILSTTKPTWPDPRSNPGRRVGNPATNRLSYGAAKTSPLLHLKWQLKGGFTAVL